MTRDVAGDAVETPALDEALLCLNATSEMHRLQCVKCRARLELSRLKARPKVSVEKAKAALADEIALALRDKSTGPWFGCYTWLIRYDELETIGGDACVG